MLNRTFYILAILLTCIVTDANAQADKWTGTWEVQYKPWPATPVITMQLQIGVPENGVLYPAKIKLQYSQFTGVYELLLVRKNDGQLGIGKGKYPLLETPFKLGIWLWYLNGTLDFADGKISVKRMWIDNFGIWMRGLYDGDEIWVSTKADLRDFLYRESMSMQKKNNTPLADSSVQRILHLEVSDLYFGIYDRINAKDSVLTIQVEDQEKHDRDTVTLLHNRKPIFTREEINDHNRRQIIRLDTGRNLFVFFADNYGGLPPNTGNLYMKIGEKEYSFDFRDRPNAFATFLVADIYHPANDITPDPVSSVNKRTTTTIASIPVDTADIFLELWDGQVQDGDSISLQLNGQWIVRGFPVKNQLQKIPVKLQRGENILLFMADNLGSIPPNTSELRIRYGNKTKTLGLSTDMGRNNAVRLLLE